MAKKKKSTSEESPKEKKSNTSLFDLISYLTDQKKPWSELTIEEQKAFSPYMINRFLSMDLNLTEAINDLQKYTLIIEKKEAYNLLFNLLPPQRFFLKYIKAEKELPDKEVNLIIKYFSVSKYEAEDYYITLSMTEEGKQIIEDIKQNYIYEK